MAAERPLGFGPGNSGTAYVQWYQPLDSTARYRTLVSGYLTPLVEFGWPAFALATLLVVAWWTWTDPRTKNEPSSAVTGLRAIIVAFGTAALFSTTTESLVLWILPTLAGSGLTALALRRSREQTPLRRHLVQNLLATLLGLSFVYGTGHWLASQARISIRFTANGNVALEPNDAIAKSPAIGFVPDPTILGPTYGHLLRELASTSGERLVVSQTGEFPDNPRTIILCGSATTVLPKIPNVPIQLLAPAPPFDADLNALDPRIVKVHLPEIDEDRRGVAWRDRAPAELIETIPGVGLRVDWAWPTLIPQLTR